MLDDALQNRARIWLPKLALACAVVMFVAIGVLSLLPSSDVPGVRWSDKISHLIAYSGLAGAAIVGRRGLNAGQVILLVIGYGLLLEAAQGLMPFGREASFLDAVANAAGALLGTAAGLGLERILRLKSAD